jgi:hypothetical protein
LPLADHASRRCHQDKVNSAAKEHFAQHEPRLDCLSRTNVIGDQEVDARQTKGFPKRKQLISILVDACAKRSLKQIAVGRGGCIPAEGTESPVKNLEAIDYLGRFELSRYSLLQEKLGRLSIFLRFWIPDLDGS